NLGSKFEFNIIHQDFLTATLPENYDLVIGNPPYGKVKASDKNLALYRKNATNKDTQNIFSFFIDKALTLSKTVALVVPKSVINAPEFQITRQQLITANINRIIDYGEKAFKGVKIETIAFIA
ncbi:Eco57I restriction-modification methylase domain-containing protein, partial [Neisseria meningitidis]